MKQLARAALSIGVGLLLFASVAPVGSAEGAPGLFRFVTAVEVTPDPHFTIGGFVRVNHVPSTDRLAVTFGTRQLPQPTGGCDSVGFAYKEYTVDLQPTAQYGVLNCETLDLGSATVGNDLYFVSMHAQEGAVGWRIVKYDVSTWTSSRNIFFPLEQPWEGNGDPMVAYVNGLLDISSGYLPTGEPGFSGYSHHNLFSTDLEIQSRRILSDTEHFGGSSMIFVDGFYYFVTASAFDGDVMVLRYDSDWRYQGVKTLVEQAHFPTGLAFDGERFYVAYLDTSLRTSPGFLPVTLNVHLAAFDRAWNRLDDVAVTNYTREDNMQSGRPSVLLLRGRLYVSYDLDTIDPVTHEERMQLQARVAVYELVLEPPPPLRVFLPVVINRAGPHSAVGRYRGGLRRFDP